jgi:hypothetical protein
VTLQNILQEYNNNWSEKENCDLHVVELGKILAEVLIMIMIIPLTPHRGFSVTDRINYYAYLYYLHT